MRLPPRPTRLTGPLLAAVLVAAAPAVPEAAGPGAPAASHPAPCDRQPDGAGWTLSSSRAGASGPDAAFRAYVGNGYLGQRVPPQGTGYAATGEKTGWPLYTPRYDGSLVAGLYARDAHTAGNRQVAAAIPTWTALDVTAAGQTFSAATPPARISRYRQTLHLRCGLVRTALTWTAPDGRATDLVYDVVADRTDPHMGAVRLRMTPHWTGEATVTDVLDGRGARRLAPVGGRGPDSGAPGTVRVGFRTDGTGTEGAVASTLRPGPGVRPRAGGARPGDGPARAD
ncbi:haloacid dehalogenase, partial [Streptomyces sp. B1866]|nr:haloacid dehalogenase [Streptomyces sp. B1866]